MQRQNILSQIEADILKFHEILSTEKNKLVLEEKVLDVLGEIEAKVSQVIGDKNGRNILQKEEVFQRYLSLNHIESQYTSIDDFLDELIVKLSQELNQRKIKLKFDLFERGNSQIDGNGIAKEKIEIKTSQKNKIFLRVLHKMGIDFADVKQFEETLTPERMRKIPYQIYHITSGNIQKTVLISDQIGQATFMYDTIISPAIFQVIEKGEKIEGNKAIKIIYNKKSYERNLEIVLGNKLTFEEKNEQIVNEVEEKAEEEIPKATKTQLQEMWKKGELTKENIGYKWKAFADERNKENTPIKNFTLPTSFAGLIGILGGYIKISMSTDYIITLLEGKEFVDISSEIKTQLQKMWKKGEFKKEYFSSKWKDFADEWNVKNSQTKKYTLPTSHAGFIGVLGGDRKISMSTDYIISLLEGKEFIDISGEIKIELQEMWKKRELTKENFGTKWKDFANKWNAENAQTKNFTIPTSINGLIAILGGDTKISKSSYYIISLLEGKEFVDISREIKIGLQEMWKNGELTKEDLGRKWKDFANTWNEQNNQTNNFTLPASLSGLIGILGGDKKISKSSDYIISLLEGKEWTQKKQS